VTPLGLLRLLPDVVIWTLGLIRVWPSWWIKHRNPTIDRTNYHKSIGISTPRGQRKNAAQLPAEQPGKSCHLATVLFCPGYDFTLSTLFPAQKWWKLLLKIHQNAFEARAQPRIPLAEFMLRLLYSAGEGNTPPIPHPLYFQCLWRPESRRRLDTLPLRVCMDKNFHKYLQNTLSYNRYQAWNLIQYIAKISCQS